MKSGLFWKYENMFNMAIEFNSLLSLHSRVLSRDFLVQKQQQLQLTVAELNCNMHASSGVLLAP